MSAKEREVTIRGIVSPVNWDEKDNVDSVLVATENEGEFYIEPKGSGRELVDFIDEYVEVTGTIRKQDDKTFIMVRQFEQIEEPDEDSDFDEDETEEDKSRR